MKNELHMLVLFTLALGFVFGAVTIGVLVSGDVRAAILVGILFWIVARQIDTKYRKIRDVLPD